MSELSSRRGSIVTAFLLGCALVPPAILLHELGHIAGYVGFGFGDPTLHYASSGFAGEPEFWALLREGDPVAAAGIVGVTEAGLSALAGLLVSYLLVALGLWSLARFGLIAGLAGAAASVGRFPPVLLLFALGRSEHTDEAHVSQALGVPEWVLVVIGIGCLITALVGGATLLAREARLRLAAATLVGVVAGMVGWLAFVGPAVLP